MSLRISIAALLVVEAAITAFGPDRAVMTPAHTLFFENLPREAWAAVQFVVAVVLVATRASRRYEITGRYLAAAVTATWGMVTLLPALHSQPWVVIGTVLWGGITALAVAHHSPRVMGVGAAMWGVMAVAIAFAPSSALAAPAVQSLLGWAGRAPVSLLCAATAVVVGYRATWPSRASFTAGASVSAAAAAAWALVWAWPAFSGGPFNLIACAGWMWLAVTSLYGIGRRNQIRTYSRPVPLN